MVSASYKQYYPARKRSGCWLVFSFILLFLYFFPEPAIAQPDMAGKYVFGDLAVYRDARVFNRFYYLPGDLQVATDVEGKPDFRLLLMRYTGTSAYGDQGSHRNRNLMQMRIVHKSMPEDDLRALKQKLRTIVADPELRPFPVKNLKTVIVYSVPGTDESEENSVSDQECYFSQEGSEIVRNEYWKERNFSARLDNAAANIFWDALQDQLTILSVGFAFYSDVFNSEKADLDVSGTRGAARQLNEMIKTTEENTGADTLLDTRVIKAGAFEVIIDTEKWPDLIRKVDINEQIPPDYAALNVYCYDFNNELRNDLAQKKIEVEATGVGGRPVALKYTFRYDTPDIYVCDLKFPYAVRIDTPYRYRITEITTGGAVSRTEWITGGSWHEILDITTNIESQSE
jgi:hypothetical protein